jgi:hypothetical protein
MKKALSEDLSIPLFLKSKDGDLKIMPSFQSETEADMAGLKLVYLGKPLEG